MVPLCRKVLELRPYLRPFSERPLFVRLKVRPVLGLHITRGASGHLHLRWRETDMFHALR